MRDKVNSKVWSAIRRAVCGVCLASASGAWAQAPALAMELAGDAGTPRAAGAPIEMRWSDADMAAHWARLSFELDGVDVTAMVERLPEGARLALPIPLSRGEHELRVVYSQADGSLVEWAQWRFAVAGDPVWRAQADMVAQLNQRLLNRGALVANAPRSTQAEGAATLRAQREAEGLDIDARAEVWLNTNQEANVQGNTLDVGEFLVEADSGSVQWRAGHHQLPYDSLIHSAYLRRGLSARLALGAGSLSGFAMRSEPLVGAQDLLGADSSRERVAGVVFERELLAGSTGLAVSAALIGGEGNDQQGTLDAQLQTGVPLHSGTAWSLATTGSVWNGQLRARAEVAGSRYDWDGGGGASPLLSGRESDGAHALAVDWQPEAGPGGASWALGYDHSNVGTFFRSVAHVGLPADKVMNRLRLNWRQGEWLAAATWMRQDTNANDLPTLPGIGALHADALLSWTPTPTEQRPWYGHPSLTGSVSGVRQRQRSTPSGFIGTPTDNRSWQSGLTAVFDHGHWSTNVGLGRGTYTDDAQPALSSRTHTLSWGAFAQIGEHWNLGPSLEWSRVLDVASGQRQSVRTASLFTDFAFVPDRFIGNLNIGLNRSRRTVDSQRETNVYAVGELIWRLKKAALNSAGWDVRLSFSHQDFEDVLDVSRSGTGNQVFLGLTMTLPAATRD